MVYCSIKRAMAICNTCAILYFSRRGVVSKESYIPWFTAVLKDIWRFVERRQIYIFLGGAFFPKKHAFHGLLQYSKKYGDS